MAKTTNTLGSILKNTKPEELSGYLEENGDSLISSERPFSDYFRACLRAKGLQQQEVFINADISESYGYKLISGEKRTRQRDMLLRLCIGARLSLEETQRALMIYGFSPLYPRLPRDAALTVAINSGARDLSEVNELLRSNGMEPLRGTEE